MSSLTARVVDPHASAQQAVGHLFGHQAALPHDFDTFTALQVHDHFLQHGVECTLDFAAKLQRDFAADKLKNSEFTHPIDTNGKQAETAVDGNNSSNGHQGSLGQGKPAPAYYAAQGRLYRAIVSLPQRLCPRDEPLHERIVFFDGPKQEHAATYLCDLLALAWGVDTTHWCEDGLIYNIQSAPELVEQNESANIDARLFEMGWGGPEGVVYADPDRVDLLVAPVLKARLQSVLGQLAREGLTQ